MDRAFVHGSGSLFCGLCRLLRVNRRALRKPHQFENVGATAILKFAGRLQCVPLPFDVIAVCIVGKSHRAKSAGPVESAEQLWMFDSLVKPKFAEPEFR